jgi:hypothetical protein
MAASTTQTADAVAAVVRARSLLDQCLRDIVEISRGVAAIAAPNHSVDHLSQQRESLFARLAELGAALRATAEAASHAEVRAVPSHE